MSSVHGVTLKLSEVPRPSAAPPLRPYIIPMPRALQQNLLVNPHFEGEMAVTILLNMT